MYHIRSMTRQPEAFGHRIDPSRMLAVGVAIGLALAIAFGLAMAVAARAAIAATFDQRVALDAQHILLIHIGPSPICAFIPNPPQHDCFWPGPVRREFSVDYLTPNGARSLLWFRLTEP
jgi:hypothetical protein